MSDLIQLSVFLREAEKGRDIKYFGKTFQNGRRRRRERASERERETMEAIEVEGGKVGEPAQPVVTDVEKGARSSASGNATATLAETFMHATPQDYLLMTVGGVAAAINGIGDPLLIVLFADSMSAMTDDGKIMEVMKPIALLFVGIGFGLQIAGTIQFVCYVKVSTSLPPTTSRIPASTIKPRRPPRAWA